MAKTAALLAHSWEGADTNEVRLALSEAGVGCVLDSPLQIDVLVELASGRAVADESPSPEPLSRNRTEAIWAELPWSELDFGKTSPAGSPTWP
jgi:hypothetical protein